MAVCDRAPAQAVAGIPALDPVPPVALVLTGSLSIQFGAALGATLFDDLGAAGTSVLRLGLAALILVALWRPRPRDYPKPALRLMVIFGLTLGAMNLCFYEALDRIPLGVAVTIEFIGPMSVAVALSRRVMDFVWIALAVAGIVLLANPFGADAIDVVGLIFVLAAAMFWAAYILLAQRAGQVFPGGHGLAMAAVVAVLVPIGPGIAQGGAALLSPELLAIGALVAIASSVIPYTLETEALRRMPARVFGVLMSLEPAVAALAGFLVLDQALDGVELVAVGLVIAASIGVTRSGAPPPVEA